MDHIVAFMGTKKNKPRNVSSKRDISEDHFHHHFDTVDNQFNIRGDVPKSPRNRSQSVFVSGFADIEASKCTSVHSTEQILSKIESLPKIYRRSHRHIGRLNTQLLEAVENGNIVEVKRLLESGANANATCNVDYVSACHIAALTGDDALPLLLQHGAEKNRTDRMGRTPLHVAAWAGHLRHLGWFLELPEEIQIQLETGDVTPEIEEMVYKLRPLLKKSVNIRCELGEMKIKVPKEWRDSIDHNCSKVAGQLPYFQPGWTPLHAATCTARHHCVRLLLAAGANPCCRDVISRTPLDVAGSAYYAQTGTKQQTMSSPPAVGFAEVVTMLLTNDYQNSSFRKRINTQLHTPLHTAVELQCLRSIALLLEAGAYPANLNREGLTPLHVCVKKKLKPHLKAFCYRKEFYNSQSATASIVDVRDRDGYTVLHYSVLTNWPSGVCLSLETGANIFSRAHNGETALHTAADLGHLDILKEIIKNIDEEKDINNVNKKGETAVLKAVMNGNIECVRMLLKKGASIEATLPDKTNVFHIAAKNGHYEMLSFLLDFNYAKTRVMVNHVTTDKKGYGPIHFAVEADHIECVKLLLSKNAFINLKATSGLRKGATPLHIAARKNNFEIAKLILKNNNSSMYAQDSLGLNALHTACYYASRDVIKLLLKEGSDISARTGAGESKFRKTAIQLLMNNVSKPTEFIEEIFDSCISCKNNLQDPSCEVTVHYEILVPNKHLDSGGVNDLDMKVIQALLETGNTYDQNKLLIHPLVESFLCLKWEALLPFFYTMLILYGLFVTTLSTFILSVYYYQDTHNSTNTSSKVTEEESIIDDGPNRPDWLNCKAWAYALYITIFLIISQEILYMKVSRRYFLELETWIKFSSIALAVVLPQAIFSTKEDWPRHFSTVALLLSWLQLTFLLSRFPKWGYYVLMFKKVSVKVLKILLTFVFLVIGFAFSFMIEYRSKIPFENPWAAFVKTMVMMTSEFDYDDLVDKKDSTSLHTSLFIIRLIFLIFLILAAIVLMNLMVAVAVNDLNNLEVQGNIMRLEKQVEFLSSLETLVNLKLFMRILPKSLKYKLKYARSLSNISLRPCEPTWSCSKAIPARIRDALIDKGQFQKDKMDDKEDCDSLQKKIDHILQIVQQADKKPDFHRFKFEKVKQRIGTSSPMAASRRDLDTMKKHVTSIEKKLDTILNYITNQNSMNE